MKNQKDRLDSIWESEEIDAFPPLKSKRRVEVCIVGGGMSGLCSAYHLAKRGHEVMVVESFSLGSGQSGRTTAHLSTMLEESYTELLKVHDEETVREFSLAHGTAIDAIEHLVEVEGIHCDFKRLDGYLFQGKGEGIDELRRELEAAADCGVKLEEVQSPPLLSESCAALRFRNQAQFHPRKFLKGLVRCLRELNVSLYEGTHVEDIRELDQRSVLLTTADGQEIRAQAVVVATDSPVCNRFAIHTKQHAYRTYAMAFDAPEGLEEVLLWDTDDPYHYVRFGAGELIVGGEDHHTGRSPKQDPFAALLAWTREKFSFAGAERWRWSGQVFEPVDQLPFIGRAPGMTNVYIITGLSGSGITGGMIGGLLVPELIAGNDHKWAALFDPSRLPKGALLDYLKENVSVAYQYTDWVTPSEISSIEEVPEDQGSLLREGAAKSCVYHDPDGHFEKKSAVCTHLGGVVHWNDVEKTWDCPCHGSRFSVRGEVIEGPAISHLSGG